MGEKPSQKPVSEYLIDGAFAGPRAFAWLARAGFENTRIGIDMTRWAAKELLQSGPFNTRKLSINRARQDLERTVDYDIDQMDAMAGDSETADTSHGHTVQKARSVIDLMKASGDPLSADGRRILELTLQRGRVPEAEIAGLLADFPAYSDEVPDDISAMKAPENLPQPSSDPLHTL